MRVHVTLALMMALAFSISDAVAQDDELEVVSPNSCATITSDQDGEKWVFENKCDFDVYWHASCQPGNYSCGGSARIAVRKQSERSWGPLQPGMMVEGPYRS